MEKTTVSEKNVFLIASPCIAFPKVCALFDIRSQLINVGESESKLTSRLMAGAARRPTFVRMISIWRVTYTCLIIHIVIVMGWCCVWFYYFIVLRHAIWGKIARSASVTFAVKVFLVEVCSNFELFAEFLCPFEKDVWYWKLPSPSCAVIHSSTPNRNFLTLFYLSDIFHIYFDIIVRSFFFLLLFLCCRFLILHASILSICLATWPCHSHLNSMWPTLCHSGYGFLLTYKPFSPFLLIFII